MKEPAGLALMQDDTTRPMDKESPRPPFRLTLRLVLVAIILAADAIFVAQNYVDIELRFLTLNVDTHLSWMLVVALLPGILIGFLLPRPWRRSRPRD
jgi:uncharacterized integral membrane protein